MNIAATIGDNNPPSAIDDALAPFGDDITEAENWADGAPVENAAQMAAVDALLKRIKAAAKAVSDARDAATQPLHSEWLAEIARWRPTITDLDRIKGCLVAAVDTFKRAENARKEDARKEAERIAWEATREAQEAARKADASNIEAQRAAADAQAKAEELHRAASKAKADTVKGLRTVHHHEIIDARAALHWIIANDRDAVTAFITAYVGKRPADFPETIVRNWTEKQAF